MNDSTEDAGQKLKRSRESLKLKYRDVEEASQRIADRYRNDEFSIALSRLSDIENKGVVPSIFRIYSLCAILRLDFEEVLGWYGIDLSSIPADAATFEMERTHMLGFSAGGRGDVNLPLVLDPGIDIRKTTYLSRMIQRWGKLPLMLLNGLDLRNYRYAYIGSEDYMMYPLLQPGSLVMIDDNRRKVQPSGWNNEFERPIYFLETRQGYVCCWCSLNDNQLILHPHPSSPCNPETYAHPEEIEVIGQVVGVAMRLDRKKRRTRAT
jgi:hypothetical protein